mgnify:FL=1
MSVHGLVLVDMTEPLRVLDGIRMRAENLDRDVVGQILLTAVDDVIQSEGALGNQGPWAPFSPNTRRRRGSMATAKLLQDTGHLAAMSVRHGVDYTDIVSPADYTIFHVLGSRDGKLPRRDPFDFKQGPVLDEIADTALEDIERGIA